MKLQPSLLAAVVAAAMGVAFVTPTATAQLAAPISTPQGTISITGQVVGDTCAVTFSGTGVSTGTTGSSTTGAAGTVALTAATTTQLAASGNVANNTPFNIVLAGCPTAAQGATTLWSGANIVADGNLKNASGTAGNVEIQLQDLNGTAQNMNLSKATAAAQGSRSAAFDGSGNVTLKYAAQYYATAQATAGTVATAVNFVVTYR
jgi:major type 1 subunit fimbrin (pilin)